MVDRQLNDSHEEQLANQATSEILSKLRNARGGERDELMAKLRSAVNEQFDIRHALQAQQIEEVKAASEIERATQEASGKER